MRAGALLLVVLLARGCLVYEYEHEFWLRVDGSGSVYVTGRPPLWTAFKELRGLDADEGRIRDAARALFEGSGLRVRRVTITHRGGRPYLFVAADFDDVNRLSGSPAFPDLDVSLARRGDRLELAGEWRKPRAAPGVGSSERDGLMALRFHLPSRIYEHRNASDGVERGNIVSWRQDVSAALGGEAVAFGASMDERSILGSTVTLFAWAIAGALAILAGGLYLAFRKGKKATG
jgi:hypothetical protein